MIRYTNASSLFEVYPAGIYSFEIMEVEQGASKKGNPQLKVVTEIIDGPHAGKKFTTWYSLLPQALFRLNMLIEASRVPHNVVGEDEKGNPQIEFDENDLVGLRFTAELTVEKYEGKDQNRIGNETVYADDEPEEEAPPAPKAAAPKAEPARQGGIQRRPRATS